MNKDLHIPSGEIQFTFCRSSGPGGQSVNKVNSKAVLRWNPSSLPEKIRNRFQELFSHKLTLEGDLILSSDESRSQKENQRICLERLKNLLLQAAAPIRVRKKTKPSRASKIRKKEEKKRSSQKKRIRSKLSWD